MGHAQLYARRLMKHPGSDAGRLPLLLVIVKPVLGYEACEWVGCVGEGYRLAVQLGFWKRSEDIGIIQFLLQL